jgi:hypothetical protein
VTEIITLADIRTHLKLDPEATDADDYLSSLLAAARRAVELRTGRTIAVDETAGDGTLPETGDLEMARHAIRLIVGTWYANRESATTEARTTAIAIPHTLDWLLEPLMQWNDGSDEA